MMKMFKEFAAIVAGSALVAGAAFAEDRKSYPAPEDHPLSEIISGYEFRTPETKALQDDDFENPAYVLLDLGAELWDTADGAAGKSCASCHGDASESMKGIGATYPKWSAERNKAITVEQQINICREEQMQADTWKWTKDPNMLGMTIFVKNQSRGMPIAIDSSPEMEAVRKLGEEVYYTRYGQLDMSCANCHEDYYGNYIRADMLSQGQINGFPTYRLKWSGVGSTHRRFKGCMDNIRANPFKPQGEEFTALEAYMMYRAVGLPIETPAVRN